MRKRCCHKYRRHNQARTAGTGQAYGPPINWRPSIGKNRYKEGTVDDGGHCKGIVVNNFIIKNFYFYSVLLYFTTFDSSTK